MRMQVWQITAAAKVIDGCTRNARCEWMNKDGVERKGILRGLTAKTGGYTRTVDDATSVWITTTDTGMELWLPMREVLTLVRDLMFMIEEED